MANKITRGGTGQASLIGSQNDPGMEREGWYMSNDVCDLIDYSSTPPTHIVMNYLGWVITTTGMITIPPSVPAGFSWSFLAHTVIGPSLTRIDTYTFQVVCLKENVSVSAPSWNATTGQWDYSVTITAEGGTPPYFHSHTSPLTISLSPKASFTLATSSTDSGSCSDSNSTVIGPAPDAPPVAGPCFSSGTPESAGGKSCGDGPICIATSGNNNVAGGAGSPQGHGGYAGVGRKGRNDNSRKPIPGITSR